MSKVKKRRNPFRSKLSKIEDEIVVTQELRRKLISSKFLSTQYVPEESLELRIEHLDSQISTLETKRNFILDRREGWLPKTIWNILVSIVVTVITVYILKFIGMEN